MDLSPLSDVVAHQYQRWVYPEPIEDLPGWLANNWQWFDPSHAHRLFWPDRSYQADFDILVAGCGANQAAVIAYTNPSARVVGIDVSEPSLEHQRWLQQRYGLRNLALHCLPIEAVASLNSSFDLILSTGVVHHLADPVRGLQALAACLRPEGVVALMLYARYGRCGVEWMQSVFRDLGLGQDEASLGMVKEAMALLPQEHPLCSYLALAPDLAYDAGLVDTFLHGRDRSYSVDDCLALVKAANLAFQEWFFQTPYVPPLSQRVGGDTFWDAVADLPLVQQWSVMERINTGNACHFFTACRRERPVDTYRIDFGTQACLAYIPSFRYRCGLGEGQVVRPGWRLALEPWQVALLQQVDGYRSIAEIVNLGPAAQNPAQPQAQALSLFRQLWHQDFIALQLPAA